MRFLPAKFVLRRSWRPFFGVTFRKKVFQLFFCKCWGPFFELKQCQAPFSRRFSGLLPKFSIYQNFWGCPCTFCTPASYITVKGNVSWKRTFLPVVAIVVLYHKHIKPSKPFTPHVIAWYVRKGFKQSIRKTKDQQDCTLQCLAWELPKSVMLSGLWKAQSF